MYKESDWLKRERFTLANLGLGGSVSAAALLRQAWSAHPLEEEVTLLCAEGAC